MTRNRFRKRIQNKKLINLNIRMRKIKALRKKMKVVKINPLVIRINKMKEFHKPPIFNNHQIKLLPLNLKLIL